MFQGLLDNKDLAGKCKHGFVCNGEILQILWFCLPHPPDIPGTSAPELRGHLPGIAIADDGC